MPDQRPKRIDTARYQELPEDNELMIIDEQNGEVRVLNAVAGGVWLLCNGERTSEEMSELLRDLFPDMTAERMRSHIDDVLLFLRQEGLVT